MILERGEFDQVEVFHIKFSDIFLTFSQKRQILSVKRLFSAFITLRVALISPTLQDNSMDQELNHKEK